MFSGSGGGWWFLLMAGLSEICYAAVIPKTDGFTRLWPTLYCAFFIAQPVAAGHRHTHAAHWHRLRRVGRHGRGGHRDLRHRLLREPANIARVACLSLFVAGVVGLKLFSPVGH